MKKLLSVMAMVIMVAVVAFPPAALAVPTLWLSDGVVTLTVPDQAVGLDLNPEVGAVTYIGAVGLNWKLNVSTGMSTPAMGSPSSPLMDLNSVDTNKIAGVGTLTLKFSDQNFTLGGFPVANMAIGGTTVGSVIYTAYFDTANGLLTTPPAGLIGTLGPYVFQPGSMGFGGDLTTNISPGNLYSLTQVVTIAHTSLMAL